MLELIREMTLIYFRLPDNIGITHAELKKLIEIKDRDYDEAVLNKINGIKRDIDTIIQNGNDTQGLIFDKYDEIDTIKKKFRPFGRDLKLELVTNKDDKLAWYCYSIQKNISEEEITFIVKYITHTLNHDDVIIEVEDYTLDPKLLNDFTVTRRIVQ